MKRYIKIFTILASVFLTASCWKGDVLPSSDQQRQVVDSLKAVAGDEEVTLSWSMAEGWNPTDFIIIYTGNGDPVTLHTGGECPFTVKNLQNDITYTFNVQAVYGEKISGQKSVQATPKTTRIAVTDLVAAGGKRSVALSWSKPDERLLSYKLVYCIEGTVDTQTATIDKDSTTYTVKDLTDDYMYVFDLSGVYPNGESLPCRAKAMPSSVIPYFISSDEAAIGQKINFRFNREGYPSATSVRWTFPDSTVVYKDEVDAAIYSKGTQTVVLNADVNGNTKEWKISLEIREYVIWYDNFDVVSGYQGFKGSCPVFSPDGSTLYDITFNKATILYAFDLKSGKVKWSYKPTTNTGGYNPLTVNPINGDIYYGTTVAGNFYCIKDDGTLKWTYNGLGSMQSCAPAVNRDGSKVFAIDASGKVVALNASDGSQIWTYAAGAKGGSMLVNGDELVVAPTTTDLVFLNITTGNVIAKIASSQFGSNRTDIAGMAVAADGNTAYLPCNGGKLFSIDLTQHTIQNSIIVTWGTEAAGNLYEPVVSPDGYVYVGSKNSFVYCIKGDLSEVRWGYTHLAVGTNNAYNYSHPCVDAAGNFYVSSGQNINSNFIIAADGTVLDQWTYGTSNNQKQMGGNNYLDGILYSAFIGGGTENGLLIGKYVGGENAASWCRHGGDICGSCCVK